MLPPNSSREKRNESFRLIERRKSPAVLIRSAKIGVEAVLVSIFIDTSADCAGSTVTSGNSNCSDSGISGASGTITGSSSFSGLPTTISSSSSSSSAAAAAPIAYLFRRKHPSGKHPDIPCTKECRSGVDHDTCRLRFLHAENRFGQALKLRRPQAKIACGLRYSDTVRAGTNRHTVIISFSLSANASSICLLNRSVSFCASASPSLAISSGMPFF